MSDQGYLKAFLKFSGYTFLAITVFFILLFVTQDENELEEFFSHTQVSEDIYDYWDYGRFTEDFINVRFNGYMELYFTGDTTGLNLDQRYYQFWMEVKYKDHFGDAIPYVNFNNIELIETDEQVGALYQNATDEQTGVIEIEVQCRYIGIGPVLYKLIMRCGHVGDEGVYEAKYINFSSASPHKLQRSLEHGIDREMESWAKRFYKIQQNEEQLNEL
ncbi:MAG TPA: hypothetical protein ENH10_04840, partial [Bacteroidetes bacterium]|nr:hypothetical protein [Bacteroidota bacterium]HEX04468.1 hypothetical protein [Bacteroidota bacterium]